MSYKLLLNTGITFSARSNSTDYDENVTFNADGHGICTVLDTCVKLRDELNLDSSGWTAGITQQITPLTSMTLGVSRSHATYPFRPLRDGKKGGMFVSTKTPDGKMLSMQGGRDAGQ